MTTRIPLPAPEVRITAEVEDKEPWLWRKVTELMEGEDTVENFRYIEQAVKEKRQRDEQ